MSQVYARINGCEDGRGSVVRGPIDVRVTVEQKLGHLPRTRRRSSIHKRMHIDTHNASAVT